MKIHQDNKDKQRSEKVEETDADHQYIDGKAETTNKHVDEYKGVATDAYGPSPK